MDEAKLNQLLIDLDKRMEVVGEEYRRIKKVRTSLYSIKSKTDPNTGVDMTPERQDAIWNANYQTGISMVNNRI